MKNYLALYIGSATPAEKAAATVDRDTIAAGMSAWGAWMAKHAAALVDAGGPLGKTKKASPDGVEDTRNSITGYVVVRANSLDEAARMFEAHPHFTIFPGDSVEIIEQLPIPEA